MKKISVIYILIILCFLNAPYTYILKPVYASTPPQILGINDQTTDEDIPAVIFFDVYDPEFAPSELSVITTSDNASLVSEMIIQGSSTNRILVVKFHDNESGSSIITLSVTNPLNLTTQVSFKLDVIPVNDAPVITRIPDMTMDEDLPITVQFQISDVETAVDELTLSYASSNQNLISKNNMFAEGTGENRALMIKPTYNQYGIAKVTVTVKDQDSGNTSSTFALNIEPINDPPTVSTLSDVAIQEDSQSEPIHFTVSDAETSGENLTVSIQSENSDLIPNNDSGIVVTKQGAAYTLILVPQAGHKGKSDIKVSVGDGIDTKLFIFSTLVYEKERIKLLISCPIKYATNRSSVPIIVRFGELVSDFNEFDIVLNNATIKDFKQKNERYDFLLVPSSEGEFSLTIPTNVATNGKGLENASGSLVLFSDKTSPVIKLLGDNPMSMRVNDEFSDPGASAFDESNGDISGEIRIDKEQLTTAQTGRYTVKYTVSDMAGNIATAERIVDIDEWLPKFVPSARVIDPDTLPVPDVTISSLELAYTCTTDIQGYFTYAPLLKTGRVYTLFFSKSNYISSAVKISDEASVTDVVLISESDQRFDKIQGICRTYSGDVIPNVIVTDPSIEPPYATITNGLGRFVLYMVYPEPYNVRANAFYKQESINLEAIKTGYVMQKFSDSLDIVLIPKTKLRISKPSTQENHAGARANNRVKVDIEAFPSFTGNATELLLLSKVNQEITFSEGVYTIYYPKYESFDYIVQADTTEDKDASKGYYASYNVEFTALPNQNATILSTSQEVTVTVEKPMFVKSKHNNSKVLIKIPTDGFQGENVPDMISVVLNEYNQVDSKIITGKILEVESTDTLGQELGKIDKDGLYDPLQKIIITMEYPESATAEKISLGTIQVRHAKTVEQLLQGQSVAIEADQIIDINTQSKTVTFETTHLSAFGFSENQSSPQASQGVSPESGSGCFIGSLFNE